MPKKHNVIRLGDEIEDVTIKVSGIAVGHIEYLDGRKSWLMQPSGLEGGSFISPIEVQASYAKRVGDGVYVAPSPPIGFRLGGMQ